MARLTLQRFRDLFATEVSQRKITWEVIGFYAPNGAVHPFGTDTKVISTVFEALAAPIIYSIAEAHDYKVESSLQTVYPDFTLNPANGQPPRIALDIKTTYRKFTAGGKLQPFRYTLGSYTSFLRSPGAAKNIAHPYTEYGDHWTLGFLYTRTPGVTAKIHSGVGVKETLACPYQNVEYFIQEKHKIVGLTPASGNTANIGSFPTNNIGELRAGRGPFAKLGKEMCDEYWRTYPRERSLLPAFKNNWQPRFASE